MDIPIKEGHIGRIICINADKRLQEFLESVPEDHLHRKIVRREVKCGFGLGGACCRFCSSGLCRISKAKPKGVCGANRDTIAARNFLRSVVAGSSCYIHVMEQATKKLKSAALARRKLGGVDAPHRLRDELGIGETDDFQMTLRLLGAVLEDSHRPYEEPIYLTERLAYAKWAGIWKNAGLPPGSAKNEIFSAIVKTSTNLNSDPMDMLTQCPRLEISTKIYELMLVNRLSGILVEEPELGFDPVGIRVIDPKCINIMVTGHQHSMFGSLTGMIEHPEIKEMTDRARARGVRIVGCMCVEQGFQARSRCYEKVFYGHVDNNYSSEAVLLTGCISLVVSEFDCSLPGIEPICEELSIPMLYLGNMVRKKGARHLPYRPEDRGDVSVSVIATAIASYVRHNRVGKR